MQVFSLCKGNKVAHDVLPEAKAEDLAFMVSDTHQVPNFVMKIGDVELPDGTSLNDNGVCPQCVVDICDPEEAPEMTQLRQTASGSDAREEALLDCKEWVLENPERCGRRWNTSGLLCNIAEEEGTNRGAALLAILDMITSVGTEGVPDNEVALRWLLRAGVAHTIVRIVDEEAPLIKDGIRERWPLLLSVPGLLRSLVGVVTTEAIGSSESQYGQCRQQACSTLRNLGVQVPKRSPAKSSNKGKKTGGKKKVRSKTTSKGMGAKKAKKVRG
eukprot:gene13874-59333_t